MFRIEIGIFEDERLRVAEHFRDGGPRDAHRVGIANDYRALIRELAAKDVGRFCKHARAKLKFARVARGLERRVNSASIVRHHKLSGLRHWRAQAPAEPSARSREDGSAGASASKDEHYFFIW